MQLAQPRQLFGRFEEEALTKGGAREQFQMLITDMVKVQVPAASTVEGPGGRDWGIDTYVGRLSDGIGIWQSKFVLDWEDDNPQSEVRASFNSAFKKAEEKGYKLRAWTLCVPCILPPEQQRWFDGWAKRTQTAKKVAVGIWNGAELRHQLLRDDALYVRKEYFPHTLPANALGAPEPEQLAQLTDAAQFDNSLFVRQLRAAGYHETDAARGLFFATDALFRDYSARGDSRALRALEELHQDIHGVWENKFNAHIGTADADGRMPDLLPVVMADAEARPDPDNLRLRPAHKHGAAHRLVEAERAGWVKQWRAIVDQHIGEASTTCVDSLEADGTEAAEAAEAAEHKATTPAVLEGTPSQ